MTLGFLHYGQDAVWLPLVALYLVRVLLIKDWAQSVLLAMGHKQQVDYQLVGGLILSVLFTNCLWGGSLCAIGSWFGILVSFWSIGLWFGNWGSL